MYTEEQYKALSSAVNYAKMICPPDEYQKRHNDLSRHIAEFLLIPYYKAQLEARQQWKQAEEQSDKILANEREEQS